jgi:putative ABC transport system permease protein
MAISFLYDLAHAARRLRKSPSYTIVAGLTLAIAIGGTTAIFSVVKAVLIDALPYRDSSRLVAVHESVPAFDQYSEPLSTIEFNLLRGRVHSFQDMGAYESVHGELSGISTPQSVSVTKITAGLLEVLGVQPNLGRSFRQDEDFDGSDAAVLSHALWAQQFGSDPSIVGRTIMLDRIPRQVLGVMPASFVFPMRGPADNAEPGDIYIPMGFTALEKMGRGPILQKSVVARLKPGVSIETANSELQSLVPSVIAGLPAQFAGIMKKGLSFPLASLQAEITSGVRTILWLLLGAVAVLLLIACANVANLSLTRAVYRKREYALRAALGASRSVLLRLTLSESFLLAIGSSFLGLAFAAASRKLVAAISPIQIPRAEAIHMDFGVFAFACFVGIATATLCGIAAALQATRVSANEALQEASRSSTGGRVRHRTLNTLVAVQFALTIILLIAGGLLLRSLANTLKSDPGFRPDHAVAITTHLPYPFYPDADKVHAVLSNLAAKAEATPGVKFAGIGTEIPLDTWEKGNVAPESADITQNSGPIASQVWVTGHFLQALGVPLKQGRYFTDDESAHNRQVVIINEALAKILWPGQNPIGLRLHNSRLDISTVVGVVGDVKEGSLNGVPVPQIYEPHVQLPVRLLAMSTIPFFRTVQLISRSNMPASTQIAQITEAVHSVDGSLAISATQPMDSIVRQSSRPQRWNTFLVATFAVIALLLAIMGIASVLGYSVAQRRGEIGIRMALGAQRSHVSRMIVRRGLTLAVSGIAVGTIGGAAIARLLRAYIHGVSTFDPLTFIAAPLLLTAIALIASYLPARRAANTDPLIVIRAD